MCGILAILDAPGATGSPRDHAARAEQLLDTLAHRGPDGRGTLALDRAWLGHRRLAIVDPAGGAQPFVDDSIAWVANAEVYNHEMLRRQHCVDLASRSDCAVIGPAWRALRDQLPSALDAQFAFVCIDQATGHWIAARDHIGICPLYVGHHADATIWFASEMKAIVRDCDRVALVEPGTMWTCDERGLRVTRWYDPDWMREPGTRITGPERIRKALTSAVEKRLMADVPWGVLLSGGFDSSIVASIAGRFAREHGLGPIHTFSIGLEGGADLAPARAVADFLGTIHHELTFTIDEALAALPRVVDHLESYQQVRTGVPTYLLAERITYLGFKMVLSGEGADELFGGYLYFHGAPSPRAFHEETVRKTTRLHQYDVMRANKAPMGFGLELRFPFLDRAVVDLAMSMAPETRMPARGPSGRPIEKAVVRWAFEDEIDPWLPAEILWRQKEQFSDGVGYAWVDELRRIAAGRIDETTLDMAAARFPEDPPCNPEMYWMRELFEARFVSHARAGRTSLATIGTGRSIACSTPEAVSWDPSWESMAGDISGRAIAGVHASNRSLTSA
jgi:asparagine synthase (glutamine-hydrolysing)